MTPSRFDGWVPIRVYTERGRPVVDWCHLGEDRFTEPFFDDTIQRCLRRPFNLLFRHQTPIDALGEWQALRAGLPPAGFIFHMSRCGSTLIAQMLAALPQNVVISEAGPIDAMLRGTFHDSDGAPEVPDVTDSRRVAWLQWLISALGQRRRGDETHLFIKFDSWNALALPLVARAFPLVPWIFVYRNPVEVIVSHLKQRGAHTVPALIGPEIFQIHQAAAERMTPEEYVARVLASICRAALQRLRTGAGAAVNYRALPDAMLSLLPAHWGLTVAEADRERMLDISRLDAKRSSFEFAADTAAKQRDATVLVRQMADIWLAPLYRELEDLSRSAPCNGSERLHT